MDDPDTQEIKALIDKLIAAFTMVVNSQDHPGMNVLTAVVMEEFGRQQVQLWEEHQAKNSMDSTIMQEQLDNIRSAVQAYFVLIDEGDGR